MSLRHLTLLDFIRIAKIRGFVRLTPDESKAFSDAINQSVLRVTGMAPGSTERRGDALLAPLRRTREVLAKHYGDDYVDELIARLEQ